MYVPCNSSGRRNLFTDLSTDYAGYADKIEGDVYPPEDGSYNFVQYEPLGVVACISAWNATYL